MMKMTRISIRLTDALLIVLLVYAMWRYGPLVEKIADAVENFQFPLAGSASVGSE